MSARDQLHAAMLAARELDEYLTAVWSCPGGVPEPIDRAIPNVEARKADVDGTVAALLGALRGGR